ncbi:MAG: hypothetical protein GXW99_04570 [Clostridiales bacterium]|nr:hypothetical protein [Clostridiales bacterium]
MNFEELFQKYKDGSATPEETAQVERELSKARLIETYLAGEILPPLPDLQSGAPTAQKELQAVKRRINARTRRIVLTTAAGILAVLLLLQYVLFPALNRRVFDTANYDEGKPSEFETFMCVFSQLHMPFANYAGGFAKSAGFGTQSISLQFFGLDGPVVMETRLTAGFLEGLTGDSYAFHKLGYKYTGNFAVGDSLGVDDRMIREIYEKLGNMPDYLGITAAMTPAQTLSIAEVAAMMEVYPDITFISAAVECGNGTQPLYLNLGESSIGFGDVYNDRYPQLWQTDTGADAMEQHLESELQFVADHPKLASWLNEYAQQPYMGYQAMLADIQKNGAKIYGLYVSGTGPALKAFGEGISTLYNHQGVQINPVHTEIVWHAG